MEQFVVFLTQIAIIVVVQTLLELIVDDTKKRYVQILAIACYGIALLLLVQFIFVDILEEIKPIFESAFTW